MSKYQFIKTKLEVAYELHQLWDDYPLYKFLKDEQWIRQRELDIAECIVDRESWIEVCRIVWMNKKTIL